MLVVTVSVINDNKQFASEWNIYWLSKHTHMIRMSSNTHNSQVNTKVLIRIFQRFDYSGLSDASARPNVIPALRLGHLPQLMQHTHHAWTHVHTRTFVHSDDTWNNLLQHNLRGGVCLPLYLRSSQTKQRVLCSSLQSPWRIWIKYNVLIIKVEWGMLEDKLALQQKQRTENEM